MVVIASVSLEYWNIYYSYILLIAFSGHSVMQVLHDIQDLVFSIDDFFCFLTVLSINTQGEAGQISIRKQDRQFPGG